MKAKYESFAFGSESFGGPHVRSQRNIGYSIVRGPTDSSSWFCVRKSNGSREVAIKSAIIEDAARSCLVI